VVLRLDNSSHVIASVVPVTATTAEEEDARDECKDDTSNSNEECPVVHHLLVIKANVIILVHESKVHANANSNTYS